MKKHIGITATAALLVFGGTTAASATDFHVVTAWTPVTTVDCDTATFQHDAIKTAVGIADKYGIRVGASQAEAQATAFEAYVPGTVVTYEFPDRYVGSEFYIELKVGYPGKDMLTHQIGQKRVFSEACEIPVEPEVPVDETEVPEIPVVEIPETQTAPVENAAPVAPQTATAPVRIETAA